MSRANYDAVRPFRVLVGTESIQLGRASSRVSGSRFSVHAQIDVLVTVGRKFFSDLREGGRSRRGDNGSVWRPVVICRLRPVLLSALRLLFRRTPTSGFAPVRKARAPRHGCLPRKSM